jgi:hypothetical protein
MAVIGLLLTGLAAGILSGLFGIGGATIIIPSLIYFFKMSQHMAQGTALAVLLPPIGLLATYKYWQAGNVNFKYALIIAAAFLIGGFIGAVIAQPLPEAILRKAFGIIFLLVALHLIFW